MSRIYVLKVMKEAADDVVSADIGFRLLSSAGDVAELIEADREFDASKARKIQADNRVICGARDDDDYRKQANAQHAYDRAVDRRRAALARIGEAA